MHIGPRRISTIKFKWAFFASSFARWSPRLYHMLLLLCCKRSAIEEINILDNPPRRHHSMQPSAVFDLPYFFVRLDLVRSVFQIWANYGCGTFLFHFNQVKSLFYDRCEIVMHTRTMWAHTHKFIRRKKSTQAFFDVAQWLDNLLIWLSIANKNSNLKIKLLPDAMEMFSGVLNFRIVMHNINLNLFFLNPKSISKTTAKFEKYFKT